MIIVRKINNLHILVKVFFFFKNIMSRDSLNVELLYLYPKENGKKHKTDKFELIHDEDNPIPILRRGIKFTLAIRFKSRGFNANYDQIRLIFEFGNINSYLVVNLRKIC